MDDVVSQIASLLKGVWKYRWPAAAVAWIVAIAGWVTVFTLPDTYQSSARVFVDTQSILKPLLASMTSLPNVEQQVSIMSRTLLSRPNVERVIRMVDLDLKANSAKDREALIDDLSKKIKIAGTLQNDIYTISYTGDNPRVTKDVVQALLTIFVEGGFGDKKQDSSKAIQFIDEQIKAYDQKLATAENALKEFKLKHLGMLPSQGSDYGSKLMEVTDNLSRARLELAEAEQAREAIKRQIYGTSTADPKGNPAVAAFSDPELDERIHAAQKNLDNFQLQYTDSHPDVIATKRLLSQLQARREEASKHWKPSADPGANASPMLQQLKVSLSAAEAQVASMRVRVQEYANRAAQLKAMSIAAPEIETQLAQLNRDYQVNRENYDKLVASREAAKLSGDVTASTEMMTFRVIDPPTTPLKPAGPNRLLLLSGVLAGGLAAGIGLALLLNVLRPTFMSEHALQQSTGLPVLGAVSMTWSDQQAIDRKKKAYAFAASLVVLILIYGAAMAKIQLKF
ncbi:polysaccharide chain length determinant protein, PEP-CTERM locus subfamily [Noviherbaspirillum humi]|uniref:Polysaccharide chain length determinant protein, PEP-CTERM locus subfamily n=1 Tax=Noviherbaspirillum humi TaxID=1688639 RepID=A0A239HJ12_9BURK|nr:XrtA system polysaccharide chain length determinant [Noviherbaspirillum humi]SNS81337.1 polysaccharide chain length determinant protein, PEP-CTERM locus subfamily [Noviherbaspirillum humi]